MTSNALEAMAKAYWNATTDIYNKWDTLDETEISAQIRAMRAVLLALAEVDLDSDFQDTIPGMIWGTSGSLYRQNQENFKAICRALAEQS